jgi:opacity protein-like surface antigen
MRRFVLLSAAIIALSAPYAIAQSEEEPAKDPDRERLGVRIGYAWTANDIEEAFGGGLDLSLHFSQRIREPLSVDVTLGAIYLGSTDSDITAEFFGTEFDDVSMRILVVTAAPMVKFPLGERTDFFFSAGAGLYMTSLILDQTINEIDLTNSNFGVNLNAGLSRRLSTNWFLDAGVYLHKIWTEDSLDPSSPDWIYLYSEGDASPLFWCVTAGVALRLF